MRASPIVFVAGATGYLGRYVLRELQSRGLPFTSVGRTHPRREGELRVAHLPVDFSDHHATLAMARVLKERLERHAVVLYAAAISNIRDCEVAGPLAYEINARAAQRLAAAVPLVLVSTDLVFGGTDAPYEISAPTAPCNDYGRTKTDAEQRVLSEGGCVARLPLLFGPSSDGRRGATDMIRYAEGPVRLFTNETHTPLHVADAARGLVDLCCNFRPRSVHHLAHPDRVSRFELGQLFLQESGLECDLEPAANTDERRPQDVSLVPTWSPDRSLRNALGEC